MVVLSIIGIIIVLILIAVFIQASNEYSVKLYGYEIFNVGNFFVAVLGYLLIYFWNGWYRDAIREQGDLLNGELLIGLVILFLLGVVYFNIKKTIISEIFYAVVTPVVFFALLMAAAFFAETKPVYNIND